MLQDEQEGVTMSVASSDPMTGTRRDYGSITVDARPPEWPFTQRRRSAFRDIFPPDTSFKDALDRALDLQESCSWEDYLLPITDAIAAVNVLVAGNKAFMILESNDEFMRWIWLSPSGADYLRQHGYGMLTSAVDAEVFNVTDEYQKILKELGRDRHGRKVSR